MRPQLSTIFTATTAGISADITDFLAAVATKPDSEIKNPFDTLERLGRSVGVSLITENNEYKMEGSWESMTAAHTLLQHLISQQLKTPPQQIQVQGKDEDRPAKDNDNPDANLDEAMNKKQIPDPVVFYSHQFSDQLNESRPSSEALTVLQDLIPTFDTNLYASYLERNFGVDVDGSSKHPEAPRQIEEDVQNKPEKIVSKNAEEKLIDKNKEEESIEFKTVDVKEDESQSDKPEIKTESESTPRRTKRKSCPKLSWTTSEQWHQKEVSESEADPSYDDTVETDEGHFDSDTDYEPDAKSYTDNVEMDSKQDKRPLKKRTKQTPKKMKFKEQKRTKKSENKTMTKLKKKITVEVEIDSELEADEALETDKSSPDTKPVKHRAKRGRQKQSPSEKKTNLPCNYCSYIGKEKSHLKEHFRRCHNSKVWKCEECGKTFGYPKDLNRHKKTHLGPQHVCDTCGKMYKADRAFEEHKKKHLEGYVKPEFECELCHKCFSTKYVLSYHIKSEHLGMKKSYLCPTCGKSFTQKNTYVQHANVHMGIKPFVCDQCGKSFTYEKSLKEHKYMHDDLRRFPCTLCMKKFRQSSALHIHMKVHKTTKDHLCGTCGKGFTQKQALLRHERIHNGDKPFCCRLCAKHFSDASIIRRHMMLIHKKDPKKWQEEVISFVEKRKDYFICKVYEGENGDNDEVENATKNVEKENSKVVPSNIDSQSEKSSQSTFEETGELLPSTEVEHDPVLMKQVEHVPSLLPLQQVGVSSRYSHSQVQPHPDELDKNPYRDDIFMHKTSTVTAHDTLPQESLSPSESAPATQPQYVHTECPSQTVIQPSHSEFSPISAGSVSAQPSPGTPVPYQTRNEAMEALVLAANQEYHNQRIAQEYQRSAELAVDYSRNTPVPQGYENVADTQAYHNQRQEQWQRPTYELMFPADPQYSQYSNQ